MKFTLTEFKGSAIVTAEISRQSNNLILEYQVADYANVVWPSAANDSQQPVREDELWRSTCLELFIATPGSPAYLEINLSPNRAWNCYEFTAYRDGMRASNRVELVRLSSEAPGTLSAELILDADTLQQEILLGPAAITENKDGKHSFFASSHGTQPDFHNHEHYVLVRTDHL